MESKRIKTLYPDRIPVIVENGSVDKDIPRLDKHKFLVPEMITCGQFMYIIRRRMNLSPEKGLFMMYGNGTLVCCASLMSDAHKMHCDEDGFLYVLVTGENVFGGSSSSSMAVKRVITNRRINNTLD